MFCPFRFQKFSFLQWCNACSKSVSLFFATYFVEVFTCQYLFYLCTRSFNTLVHISTSCILPSAGHIILLLYCTIVLVWRGSCDRPSREMLWAQQRRSSAPISAASAMQGHSCQRCAMVPTSSLRVEHLLSVRLTTWTLTSWLPIRPCKSSP